MNTAVLQQFIIDFMDQRFRDHQNVKNYKMNTLFDRQVTIDTVSLCIILGPL